MLLLFACFAAGKLSADDLNALIAHAHRRIDQLNTELAEQRVREQIHIEAALLQQKEEHQRALEKAVGTALQHAKEESRLEQEGKVSWGETGVCWSLNVSLIERSIVILARNYVWHRWI